MKKEMRQKTLTVVNGGGYFMKNALAVMVAIAALTACTNDGASEVLNNETAEVRMTFTPYDVEPLTRAGGVTRAAVADYATRLDVWVYEGGTEHYAEHQQSTDDGFGSLTLTLDKTKTYTLYAAAHKGDGAATLANGVVAFPNDKVTHSFFYSQTFSPATSTTLNCIMERIVGNFRVEITDAVPDGVAQMEMSIGESPTRWDVGGYGVNLSERTASFTPAAGSSPTLSTFIIADGEEDTAYTITVTAYDADDDVVQSRTFSDVPVRNGYRSIYRGNFFTDQAVGMTFTVNDWSDYDTVDF